MANEIRSAVLDTIAYANNFCFPLKKEEIFRRLISSKKTSFKAVSCQIDSLLKKGLIEKKDDYFFPAGSSLRRRSRPDDSAREKIMLANRAARLIKFFPWVVFVGLTGSLAAENSGREDDIDLMVITCPKRLWLTRICVYFQFRLIGRFWRLFLRRRGDEEVRNKICLNLFLTADNLVLPRQKQNLFNAYQLMFLKPLLDKGNFYLFLRESNYFWFKKHLANCPSPSLSKKEIGRIGSDGLMPVDFLERLAFWLQRKYMPSGLAGEIISPRAAFFHPKKPNRFNFPLDSRAKGV